MSFLVHGIHDQTTLSTLRQLGVREIGFDIRPTSLNFIPMHTLSELLLSYPDVKPYFIFENEAAATIESFLDLIKGKSSEVILEFRDRREAYYYRTFNSAFIWMFHPNGDWENILKSPNLRGLLLPTRWKEDYQSLPKLWQLIEERRLDVYLHAGGLALGENILKNEGLKISLDISSEVEAAYRVVDQEKLRSMKVWGIQ